MFNSEYIPVENVFLPNKTTLKASESFKVAEERLRRFYLNKSHIKIGYFYVLKGSKLIISNYPGLVTEYVNIQLTRNMQFRVNIVDNNMAQIEYIDHSFGWDYEEPQHISFSSYINNIACVRG